MHAQSLFAQLFVTPWTVAHQAPLSVEFSRQEYWSGLPFPSPEDLPDPGIEPMSPALAGGFFLPQSHLGSPNLSEKCRYCPLREKWPGQCAGMLFAWILDSMVTGLGPELELSPLSSLLWYNSCHKIIFALHACSVVSHSLWPHGLYVACQALLSMGFSSARTIWARILEWVAISFSKGSPGPRDQTHISCSGRWIIYHGATWKSLF